MKPIIRYSLMLIASLPILLYSCVKEQILEPEVDDNMMRVPVSLALTTAAMENGDPSTKVVLDPDNGGVTENAQINNFVILQFDGISGTSHLVGGQTYVDHWPLRSMLSVDDPNYDATDVVTLVAYPDPCAVIILANVFDRVSIQSGTTLQSFLDNGYTTISSLSGVLTPFSENDYFRLSGSVRMESITAGSSLDVILKRNVSKVIVNITNNTSGNTGDDVVTLSKVQLLDVNGKYYYLTNIDPSLTGVTFTDPYTSSYPTRFNSEQKVFPVAGNSGVMQTFSYYVPANLRGTISNTSQYRKGLGAPLGSTFLRLYGTYGVNNTPIEYTYYLGENLWNDFNLQPNKKYTYNITINSKGNASYDYRIDDLKEVRFETDANSYMLHPPQTEGQTRTYAIPVRRAAVFWNTTTDNWPGIYEGSGIPTYSAYTMDSGTAWTAEVLWSDFQLNPSDFLQVASGRGFDPTLPSHTDPYFKVRVSSGMEGNVVVGVKMQGSETILWSWHFWITDYDPDRYVTKAENTYIYPVENGNVHRYKNVKWDETVSNNETHVVGYLNGFAMDRNYGSKGVGYVSLSDGVAYQWGRKDPFSQNGTIYIGGTGDPTSTLPAERIIDRSDTEQPDENNTRYSIQHPMTFIKGDYYWTKNTDNLSTGTDDNNLWNDPKYWEHTGNQNKASVRKSFYDPCPPGWAVPVSGTWNGLVYSNSGNGENYTVEYYPSPEYKILYYPEGYSNRNSTGAIVFPLSGGRLWSTGSKSLSGFTALWSSTPYASANSNPAGVSLFAANYGIWPQNTGNYYHQHRTFAFPVRCVRE